MRTPPGVRAGGTRRPPTLADVLRIDQATYDAIVAHAKRDHPDEACGVVAGPEGSDRPERFVAMVNAAGSPDVLRVRLHRAARALQGDGRPRRGAGGGLPLAHRDRGLPVAAPTSASPMEPDAHYVLVSTREHGNSDGPVEFRSYRIIDGEVTEEEVAVVATDDQT